MSVVVRLRPCAPASFAALSATAVFATAPSASAQQYVPPYKASSQYGAPYSPPPSMAGARRPLDSSYSAPQYGSERVRPGIWNGLYLGGNAGYAVGDATPSGSLDTIDISGGSLGVHAGYNWQFRDWVLGLEGDAAWNGVEGSRTFSGPLWVQAQNDWTATLRVRAGYSFSNLLVYATGGLAWSGVDLSSSTGATGGSTRETLLGYVIGGGLEMKVTSNISARLEALHYGFNDDHFTIGGSSLPIDTSMTTLRAGLTFHFN